MGANAAGIAGSQVFRTQDAPLYMNAFTACLTLSALVLVLVAVQSAWYVASNRALDREARSGDAPAATAVIVGSTAETPGGHKEELVKRWRWTW